MTLVLAALLLFFLGAGGGLQPGSPKGCSSCSRWSPLAAAAVARGVSLLFTPSSGRVLPGVDQGTSAGEAPS